MPVKAGQRHDLVLGYDVEDTVGKSAEERPANLAVDNREGKRIALDGFETMIKGLKELVTKVMTSFSVPRENPLDVSLRRGREAQDHFLRAKESRTCDQGRAACGSFW